MVESPVCFRCGKKPSEIEEYREMGTDRLQRDDGYFSEFEDGYGPPIDPLRLERLIDTEFWMAVNEGTYNRETNTFCCTNCYIAIGCPSASGAGWKAPSRERGEKRKNAGQIE